MLSKLSKDLVNYSQKSNCTPANSFAHSAVRDLLNVLGGSTFFRLSPLMTLSVLISGLSQNFTVFNAGT